MPIDPTDIELVILADDRSKRRSEIWLFGYHPKTFLGSVWAFDRWTGLIDTGLLVHQRQRTLKCAFCETEDNLIKTKSKPVKFVCRQCYSINRCACGALVRFTYAGKRVCGSQFICTTGFITLPTGRMSLALTRSTRTSTDRSSIRQPRPTGL